MKKLAIGFTGTQDDMTMIQELTFRTLIVRLKPHMFEHGDCIGSDRKAHLNVRWYSPETTIRIHPPTNSSKRAYCTGDIVLAPLEYLSRNKQIVNNVSILVATPKSYVEELRSGTWATIRYARKTKREIYIIYPDGTIDHEVPK